MFTHLKHHMFFKLLVTSKYSITYIMQNIYMERIGCIAFTWKTKNYIIFLNIYIYIIIYLLNLKYYLNHIS